MSDAVLSSICQAYANLPACWSTISNFVCNENKEISYVLISGNLFLILVLLDDFVDLCLLINLLLGEHLGESSLGKVVLDSTLACSSRLGECNSTSEWSSTSRILELGDTDIADARDRAGAGHASWHLHGDWEIHVLSRKLITWIQNYRRD